MCAQATRPTFMSKTEIMFDGTTSRYQCNKSHHEWQLNQKFGQREFKVKTEFEEKNKPTMLLNKRKMMNRDGFSNGMDRLLY